MDRIPVEIVREIIEYLPYKLYMSLRLIFREHPETIIPKIYTAGEYPTITDISIMEHLYRIGALYLFNRTCQFKLGVGHICPEFAYKTLMNDNKVDVEKLEDIISTNAQYSYLYAKMNGKRFRKGEMATLTNPYYAGKYSDAFHIDITRDGGHTFVFKYINARYPDDNIITKSENFAKSIGSIDINKYKMMAKYVYMYITYSLTKHHKL
jgi:hypothetical protein